MKEPLYVRPLVRRIYAIFPARVQRLLRGTLVKVLRITKKDLDFHYNETFATGPVRNKPWTEDFCTMVIRIFNPKSIIDFGCGTGDILRPFEKRGIPICGIDGSKANQRHAKIEQHNFQLFDLRNTYKVERAYDIAFCFEVAEHIEEKCTFTLIKSLTEVSPLIIFSASPSSAGVDHCNVHPYEWWIDTFRNFSFEIDRDLTHRLKQEMYASAVDSWYIENVMVFKRSPARPESLAKPPTP